MPSRAKIDLVAVLTGKYVKSNVPKVFFKFSSTLDTKFGVSMTSGDIRLITASTSFNPHCNRSPDSAALF